MRTTGCPPRSETPFTISSFAKTVPNAGHQFTSVSDKKVKRYCNKISCFLVFEKFFQSSAEKEIISSSETAFTFVFPSFSKTEIKVLMSSALSISLLYQELNN